MELHFNFPHAHPRSEAEGVERFQKQFIDQLIN